MNFRTPLPHHLLVVYIILLQAACYLLVGRNINRSTGASLQDMVDQTEQLMVMIMSLFMHAAESSTKRRRATTTLGRKDAKSVSIVDMYRLQSHEPPKCDKRGSIVSYSFLFGFLSTFSSVGVDTVVHFIYSRK